MLLHVRVQLHRIQLKCLAGEVRSVPAHAFILEQQRRCRQTGLLVAAWMLPMLSQSELKMIKTVIAVATSEVCGACRLCFQQAPPLAADPSC